MHCNMWPPDAISVLFRFYYDANHAMPSLKSLNLPDCSVFAADIYYFTLWTWPLTPWRWPFTVDLEHSQCIPCNVMKLYQIWTQLSNPRRSYCDFNIWPNDLERRITCCARLWDNIHHVWPATTYTCLYYGVFEADTLCHAVILTSDPLTRHVIKVGTKCEWNRAIPRLNYCLFCEFLHTFCRAVTLTFDLLILKFCSTWCVTCLDCVQNLNEIEYSTAELVTI